MFSTSMPHATHDTCFQCERKKSKKKKTQILPSSFASKSLISSLQDRKGSFLFGNEGQFSSSKDLTIFVSFPINRLFLKGLEIREIIALKTRKSFLNS